MKEFHGFESMYMEPVKDSAEWYWCDDSGVVDLYDAEQMARSGGVFPGMRGCLIHFPDGRVYEPFPERENVYVERPVWNRGRLYFLKADWNSREISLFVWNGEEPEPLASIPCSDVKDCYNLQLISSPVTLVRSDGLEDELELIWPERRRMRLEENESVQFRDEMRLYMFRWQEDPEYHEEVLIRDVDSGEILARFPGSVARMPDGSIWKMTK